MFAVAYKRFVDIIPSAIDHEFVWGIERDLESVLYAGLGVSGPKGQQICKDLAQEPANTSIRREALHRQLDRLKRAQKELLHIGG
jgi:Dynamin GTPase effector domain